MTDEPIRHPNTKRGLRVCAMAPLLLAAAALATTRIAAAQTAPTPATETAPAPAPAPAAGSNANAITSLADLLPNAPPLYKVEVIVFGYNNPDAQEIFQPNIPSPSPTLEGDTPNLEQFDLQAFTDSLAATPQATIPSESLSADSTNTSPAAANADSGTQAANPIANDTSGSQAPLNSVETAPSAEDLVARAMAARMKFLGSRGFHIVTGDQPLALSDAYAKLQRSAAYTPVLHAAWIEPALTQDKAKAIPLSAFGIWNPSGTIRFYQSRYLHVVVDLAYVPPEAQQAAIKAAREKAFASSSSTSGANGAAGNTGLPNGNGNGNGNGVAPSGAGSVSGAAAVGITSGDVAYGETVLQEISFGPRLTLKASRRIDPDALQYFDHPYFGLLILVTPYEIKTGVPEPSVPPAA